MREELLAYYERELTYLRQMGAEFAQKYPKIASRLMLEADRCADPHVERLLEAFAFLAARVHLKIDDDFPEITNALFGILYPHYIRPIPSMSVVQLHLDPEQGKLTTGLVIPREAMLHSREVEGVPCKFRTCYETTLWPVNVAAAQWLTPDRLTPPVRAAETVGAIRLVLKCLPDVSFDKLEMRSLRFYLSGESKLVHTLYELLCNNCNQILLRNPGPGPRKEPVVLSPGMLRPVGFEENEALLPYPRRSFSGYRLLQEYFTFPEKFFFLDLDGLEALGSLGLGSEIEIVFLLKRFERSERAQMLEMGVTPQTFRLGCTPIVNLFAQTAEPILLDQTQYEYPIVPDVRRQYAMEIFSVDDVVGTNPRSREITQYLPFYTFHHAQGAKKSNAQAFWQATRRSAGIREDERSDVFLSLLDMTGAPVNPEADAITVRCTCTNFTLPSRLPFGSEKGDFELQGVSAIRKIVVLHKLTPTLRPPSGKGALWRLLSHLSLNYLSLVDEGKEALQQILNLYNFSDSIYLHNQISGITSINSTRHFAPVVTDNGVVSARGTRVDLELDEEQFVGGGVYLFSSVIERFLGSYVSMNSFSQLVASTVQRKEVLREWAPRAGRAILI
ncbi:MAG: type VI secretion system baseplate subunit TssF [Candidatus Korobacteraceae bacterium]|jgi:type VI secretion system protein ImpG